MNVKLTPESATRVQARVKTGQYDAPARVVEAALRLLDDHERLNRLRAEVAIGAAQLARGEGGRYSEDLMERLKVESVENARRGKPTKDVVRP